MRGASSGRRVLVVDDDRDIAELAREVLHEAGHEVFVTYEVSVGAITAAVDAHEPDVVLLDGASDDWRGYGESWDVAARLSRRPRPVPVIMFTAHNQDLAEARVGESERSRFASFVAILGKPFDVEELLRAVERATARPSF